MINNLFKRMLNPEVTPIDGNTQLRFQLVELLIRMKYGQGYNLSGAKVYEAWPPTGDCNSSVEAAFQAFGLAASGNRPVISMTTDERIANDLDGSFIWYWTEDHEYLKFYRKIEACPRCKGMGVIYTMPPISGFVFDASGPITKVPIDWQDCTHEPV